MKKAIKEFAEKHGLKLSDFNGNHYSGYLDLEGTGITNPNIYESLNPDYIFTWQNGKYIKADGIFAEVINRKKNVDKLRKIGSDKEIYLVVEGGKMAHGDTIKEAKSDLIYKFSERDKSEYENLTTKSVLSFSEAIQCYHVITGACSTGIKNFVESVLDEKKDEYIIAEMIKLTNGQYNSEMFANFFKK